MSRTGLVYAIANPKTLQFCYIGETLDFPTRQVNHLRELRNGKHTNWKLQRLYKHLVADGFDDFIWVPLEWVIEEYLNDCEVGWIARMRMLGIDLYNISDGGDGRHGAKNPCSAETRAKISATLTGRKLPESVREKLRGRKHTEEWKDQASDRMKGNTLGIGKPSPRRGEQLSEEHRQKLIDAKANPNAAARGERAGAAKLTEDDVRAIRKAHVDGECYREIGGRFGISLQNVWYITNGITWKHVPTLEEHGV